jgi:hypothetical protein
MKHDVILKDKFIPSREKPNAVWRAVSALVRGHIASITADSMAKSMYPDDSVTPVVLKAVSTQATTSNPSWAGSILRYAVDQSIEDIVAMSVAWRLELAGALRVQMGNLSSVTVPGRSQNAANAGQWVQEGQAIPVRQQAIYPGAKLTPQKLACIVTMTREITEASNIEDVLKMLMTEAAGMAIDNAMFSTSAATAAQPAGLLNGLTPLASSASTLGFDGCGQDLGTLVQDIATRGGGRKAFFVGAPKQATSIRFWAGGQFAVTPATDVLPVAASIGMPAGSVAAIEPESLAFSISDPEFAITNVAALHQEDTSPQNITGGSPSPAVPVKSMFQTEAFALRMVVWASWGMRAPHVSFMDAVPW